MLTMLTPCKNANSGLLPGFKKSKFFKAQPQNRVLGFLLRFVVILDEQC